MARAIPHLFAVLLLLAGVSARAATFLVDRFDDVVAASACLAAVPADCSLRGALLKANLAPGLDTVRLAAGTYSLTIAGSEENAGLTGDLDLTDDVILEGAGAGITILEAEHEDRVVDVRPGVIALLQRLNIEGGSRLDTTEGGAGIRSVGQVLILQRCQVANNSSAYPGGGILSASGAGLWLQDTLVWLNVGHEGGGGIRIEGAGALLTIENSSVVANSVATGAAELDASDTVGTIRNSTLSEPFGGEDLVSAVGSTLTFDASTLLVPGPARALVLTGSTVTLGNTLVAGSCAVDAGSTITTLGGNLESPGGTCGLGASDLDDVPDPKLALLDRYGGPTPTHRPFSDSPAVNFFLADSNCLARDQRGIPRPQGGGLPGTPHCDIGAVERVAHELFLDGFEGGTWWGWSRTAP